MLTIMTQLKDVIIPVNNIPGKGQVLGLRVLELFLSHSINFVVCIPLFRRINA